jgi:hypothetical protein
MANRSARAPVPGYFHRSPADSKPRNWIGFIKSLAPGYVARDVAHHINGFEVELIGECCAALRLPAPAFDPDGQRMRA